MTDERDPDCRHPGPCPELPRKAPPLRSWHAQRNAPSQPPKPSPGGWHRAKKGNAT